MRRWLTIALVIAPTACWSAVTSVPDVFGAGAASDGGAGDGASPEARASDGASEAAPGGPFCASYVSASLCDDFEHGGPPETKWKNTEIDRGTLEIEAREDGGHALLVRSPASGAPATAILSTSFSGLPAEARISFDLRADAFSPSSAIVVAAFRLDQADGGYSIIDLWGREHLGIVQELPGDSNGKDSLKVFPTGEWRRVVFDAVFGGSNPHASVTVDGTLHDDVPIVELKGAVDEQLIVNLGMRVGPPDPMQGPTTLHFDNVVVEISPR